MKPLAALPAALALAASLAAPGSAQTAPPAAATHAPWLPRPVIIVDPRAYLASPTPAPRPGSTPRPRATSRRKPHPHATPAPRRPPSAAPTPETFERIDTSPPPKPPRAR